jgi:hypothetical protein
MGVTMNARTLRLRREVLTELSGSDLRNVVGAQAGISYLGKELCAAVSAAVAVDCARPSCGPGCTAISNNHAQQH